MGIREEQERNIRADAMPHRKHAGDDRLDARLESTIGRLFFSGEITQSQYEAGVRYGLIGLRYLDVLDGPAPYSAELGPISEDICFGRKVAFVQARAILKGVGSACAKVVDRVAIYDEEPRGDFELAALRKGLSALCGELHEDLTYLNLAAAKPIPIRAD